MRFIFPLPRPCVPLRGAYPPPSPTPSPGPGRGVSRGVRASKVAQNGPKRASDAPRLPPRRLKTAEDAYNFRHASKKPQEGHKTAQDGPTTGLRSGTILHSNSDHCAAPATPIAFSLPMRFGGLEVAPRWPNRAPGGAQEAPKTAPRAPKIAPRSSQEAPTRRF